MRKLLLATVATVGLTTGFVGIANAQSSPAPGTVTVRLNGRVNFYAAAVGTTADNVNGNKLARYGFQGYMRLYPGFDGVAANGLHYGAAVEIRQNGGAAGNGTSSGTETLFVRRAYGYFGLPQFGTVRFGQTDGPFTLFQTGTFEGFNDGGWNGDVPGFVPGNVFPTYPFADNGNLYATQKIVYLSPQVAGFDFGVSYEPSTAAFNIGQGACAEAMTGCDRLSSSTNPADAGRRRNTFEAELRYTGNFAGFGVKATVGAIHSGRVNYTGAVPAQQFKDLSVGDFGLELSYAGFTVGGNLKAGQMNGLYSLEPKGGKTAIGFLVGGQYAIGPAVIGANYFNYQSTGDFQDPAVEGQRVETGIAAGGTYTLAPGVSLFASYLYGTRKQGGFNFITGQPGNLHNYVQAQVIAVGTQLKW